MARESYYNMEKLGWDDYLGSYSKVIRDLRELTRKEMLARVRRLPETTVHFWRVIRVDDKPLTGWTFGGAESAEEVQLDESII